jgi:cytochrome b6-f complex iron-sulfur subunit
MLALVRTLFGVALVAVVGKLAALVSRFHQGVGSQRVTRRTFLRNTILGSVGIVLLQAAGGFVYFFWPNKTGAFGKEIPVPAAALPAVGGPPYVNQAGKFYLINNEDGALAMYWKCPHLGCTVPFDEASDEFHCPCHGSVYNRVGERTAGPAPRPMDLMTIRVDGDQVFVDTGDISTRGSYEPSQATKLPG